MRVREDVTDVERPADGRRRRIDRIDLIAGAIAGIEAVGAVRFPLRVPLRLEAFECRLLWKGDGAVGPMLFSASCRRCFDARDLLSDQTLGDVATRPA